MNIKKFVNFFFCHFLYHVKYNGLENLNKYNQFLICPNHSNIFDPFFIYPVSHNLYIMAKVELFKHKFLAKMFKRYNVFPVDRTKRDPKSLFYCLEIFNTSEHRELLIFPEGGILKKGELIGSKVRNGATFVSAKMNIPIVPVYITRLPKVFSRVNVVFGKPIFIPNYILDDKKELKCKSKELIDTIYNLNI